MTKVDLITGFLGAGKTTFIKKYGMYLKKQGQSVVIIENEFGVGGIDTAFLQAEQFTVNQLVGGCICCTQKVNFHDMLIYLAKEGVDRILVEPSGIYNVDEFFDIMESPPVKEVCQIGSILTIVEPGNLLEYSNDVLEVMFTQLIYTGRLLLSKTDYMSQEKIRHTIEELEYIMMHFGKDRRELSAILVSKPWDEFQEKEYEEFSNAGYACYGRQIKRGDHTKLFSSTTMEIRCKDQVGLMQAIEKIMDGSCGRILRMKGYVVDEHDNCYEVNCTMEHKSVHLSNDQEPVMNIIGTQLNRKRIKEVFSFSNH